MSEGSSTSSEYPSRQDLAKRRSSAPERPSEIASPGPRPVGSRIAMSGLVQRLARDLGKDPEELAQQIDPDTLRRTKYAVLRVDNPDGTTTFKHDPGIVEGRKSTHR